MTDKQERRTAPRIRIGQDTPITCTITTADPGNMISNGTLRDASRTGFGLLSHAAFAKGTDLQLDLHIGDSCLRGIRAFVVHAEPENERDWRLGIALDFRATDMLDADRYNRITALLEELRGVEQRVAVQE
jgi:hypothetical protein